MSLPEYNILLNFTMFTMLYKYTWKHKVSYLANFTTCDTFMCQPNFLARVRRARPHMSFQLHSSIELCLPLHDGQTTSPESLVHLCFIRQWPRPSLHHIHLHDRRVTYQSHLRHPSFLLKRWAGDLTRVTTHILHRTSGTYLPTPWSEKRAPSPVPSPYNQVPCTISMWCYPRMETLELHLPFYG